MSDRAKKPYTADEFRRFKKLVEQAESRVQMDRIHSRLAMPKFIAEVGREKCDLMFKVLCGGKPCNAE